MFVFGLGREGGSDEEVVEEVEEVEEEVVVEEEDVDVEDVDVDVGGDVGGDVGFLSSDNEKEI